jgi:hypothetical protein
MVGVAKDKNLMRKFSGYWLALGLFVCAASSFSASLSEIERWTRESADALSIADLESEIAKQRLQIVSGESGIKWTLGSTVGQYQEPLTETTSRNYSGINTVAGVRIPVIGSAEASRRNVDDAQKNIRISLLQREIKLDRLIRDLRLAYSSYVRNTEKNELTKAWLSLEVSVRPLFLARTREHLLLEADRLALESGFKVALRDLDRYTLAVDASLATLRRLSKHSLEDIQPLPPLWSTQCFQIDTLHKEVANRPAVALKAVELEVLERQTDDERWGGLEAGITLQQSFGRNFGGQDGQSTMLGVDMTMPVNFGSVSRARLSVGQLKLQQARRDIDMTLTEQIDELDSVLGRLRISKTDLTRTRQRLDASLESNRIAVLRESNISGDVLERALMARYQLYLSAIDFVDTVQRTEAAKIDALSYGAVCPEADQGLDLKENLVDLLSQPISGKLEASTANNLALSWFLWHGDAILKDEPISLPSENGRLLASFTKEQLLAIESDVSTAQHLRQNLDRLHRSGWKVDLVFGDSSFVLPQGRNHLVNLVRAMTSFPFDGLNLDLERSDLPPKIQHQWGALTLQTLRAVRRVTPWPITLTTHFREFDQEPMMAEVQRAGLKAAMAMIYVNDLAKTTEISRRILLRQPNLPITVVQSVEPQLSDSESGFTKGQDANLSRWKEIGERLSGIPNFVGIAVQSLENFNAMKP